MRGAACAPYLILKEKAEQWNADEDSGHPAGVNADTDGVGSMLGAYSAEKAEQLKAYPFDRAALGARGLNYERLDQLTVEVLLGVR